VRFWEEFLAEFGATASTAAGRQQGFAPRGLMGASPYGPTVSIQTQHYWNALAQLGVTGRNLLGDPLANLVVGPPGPRAAERGFGGGASTAGTGPDRAL
jgi:hypothetical protein